MPTFLSRLSLDINDFTKLRHGRLAYVDKTRFIEIFENEVPKLLNTRPSGFGKTLVASTLSAYCFSSDRLRP